MEYHASKVFLYYIKMTFQIHRGIYFYSYTLLGNTNSNIKMELYYVILHSLQILNAIIFMKHGYIMHFLKKW
jgi:hypothetical protein